MKKRSGRFKGQIFMRFDQNLKSSSFKCGVIGGLLGLGYSLLCGFAHPFMLELTYIISAFI